MVVYDGDMQKWVWRYFLVIILSAWITFTLLMIQSGTAITTTASEAAANVPLYQAPPPTTLRLSGTTSDLTIPSFRFLATGNIWSYVSKQRSIDPDFTPPLTDELATSFATWVKDKRLQPRAAPATKALLAAAASANQPLLLTSAYRSGADQAKLIGELAKLNGQAYANDFVAKPGQSEHQLGLAIDLTSHSEACRTSFDNCKLSDAAAAWLAANAHTYGFILRYPPGKEAVTGVPHESWHFRYVGTELAKVLHSSGLTFDEAYQQLNLARTRK